MQGLDEKHTINDTRLERKNHSSNFYFTRCKKKEKKRKLKIMKIKDFHFQLFHHCSTNSIVGNVEKRNNPSDIYQTLQEYQHEVCIEILFLDRRK